jgi:hypothetical protein
MSSRHFYKRRVVFQSFKSKGFKEIKGGKHTVFVLLNEKNQQTNIKTSIINPHSGSAGDVKLSQVKNMASDIGLENHLDFLHDYIECKNKHEDLLRQLRENGLNM